MAPLPSIRSQPQPPNFNYPSPGSSLYSPSYPSGFPGSYSPTPPSYPGSLDRPMIPVPSIGPSLPLAFQTPPPIPSYTFVPPSRPPSFSSPSFRPPPSFDSSTLSGRVEPFNPPFLPSGPPSWATPSLPPHLSPSYPTISSLTGSSPSAYSLNPPSVRYPSSLPFVPLHPSSFSLPPSVLIRPSFSEQTPSLSGRAHYVSSFTSSSHGMWSPRNQEVTVSAPYSLSRSPFPSETLGKVPRNFSCSIQAGSFFAPVVDRLQFQNTIRRQFDETMKILYHMGASPERPFPIWGTVGVTQFVVQINPRTTMLIDSVAVTEFFQRASETQKWAVQAQLVQLSTRPFENTGRIQGVYERVILHINDLPGIGGGQGVGGHVFLEFPDRKLFFGSYPKLYKYDEKANVNSNTTSIESYCDSSKVTKGLELMEKIKWTRAHNCVYTAVEGLKIMEFIHADELKLSKFLPLPSEIKSQMLELNGLDPNIVIYPRKGIKISSASPFSVKSQDVTNDFDHSRVREVTESERK